MSHDVPRGWLPVELGEHVYIAGRIGWRGLKAEEYTVSGPSLLSVPNLNHGDIVDFSKVSHISRARYDESPEIWLKPGDTLLVKDGAGIGKIGYIKNFPGQATVNSSLLVVRPSSSILLTKYLFYYLKGPQFQEIALGRITGSATPHLFQKDIKRLRVLVPPLEEQRRLVAVVDKILQRVCECQRRLAKIPVMLRRFRRSVLAAAFSGRLTADWRELHPDVETATALVVRIDKWRDKGNRTQARGSDRRTQSVCVKTLTDQNCPDELIPDTWLWVEFGSLISELRNGVSRRPNIQPPGIPILRIGAVRPGSVDTSDIRYMLHGEEFLPAYAVRDNDLLFTRYNGSIEFLGVCGLVRGVGKKKLIYPDKLMRVRFDCDMIIPSYVEMFFQSPAVHERIVSKSKSSAGQNGISGGDLKAQAFALAPVLEQQEIVRRVEALFALSDRIEERYLKAKKQVDSLTQSILAKAFRGELVSTEAEMAERECRSYESAEQMLQRIRSFKDGAKPSGASTNGRGAQKANKKRGQHH